MNTTNRNVELECKDFLNSFFDSYCNDTLRKRALKALRFLVAGHLRRRIPFKHGVTMRDIRVAGLGVYLTVGGVFVHAQRTLVLGTQTAR